MSAVFETLYLALEIYSFIVIVYIILQWLIHFQIVNVNQPFVKKVMHGLQSIIEPVLAKIRKILPPTSGIDFSPIVLFLLIFFVQRLIVHYALSF